VRSGSRDSDEADAEGYNPFRARTGDRTGAEYAEGADERKVVESWLLYLGRCGSQSSRMRQYSIVCPSIKKV
jgi:hypothetical protein